MYGKHVILFDTLTDEQHDALVVLEQAATEDGPKELLTVAYIRKDGPKHAMHEHRILYRQAVRPKDHLDVKQGKVTHYYTVPDGSVGIGGDAAADEAPEPGYALFVDGVQQDGIAPGDTFIGVLDAVRSIRSIVVGDLLAINGGAAVTSITKSDDGTMVNILAETKLPQEQDAGDPPQGGEAALAEQAAADAAVAQ